MPDTNAVRLQHARGPITVDRVALPDPGPGEALLRLEACGLCHSDLFVASLEKLPLAPVTLGHEGIARIEALGPETDGWFVGDRAGVTFLATTCGVCDLCRSGAARFCPRQTNFGFTAHGALSEFAIVPARALVRVPEGVDAAVLAPMCCAGWTACGAFREAALSPGQSVAIFGYGGLGHLAVQLAQHHGIHAAVSDPAKGAEIAPRQTFDAAMVFTGSPAAIPEAFKRLKRRGRLILVGISANQYELPLIDTILKGVRIQGSYLGTPEDLATAFDLAARGVLRPHLDPIPLADAPSALDRLHRAEIQGRAVVRF